MKLTKLFLALIAISALIISPSCSRSYISYISSGTSQTLWDVWGSSDTDVFVVGEAGTILHYDGASWSEMDSGTVKNLYGIWGSSSSDMFAVGEDGTVLHYDGVVWSQMDTLQTNYDLKGVYGTSAANVFAVGISGLILHYDGTTWQPMESSTTRSLKDVWCSSPTNIFAVGPSTILHYNGNSWSNVENDMDESYNSIWGTSPTNIFAVGFEGAIFHYNGGDWNDMSVTTEGREFWGAWGSSSNDIYTVGALSGTGFGDGTSIIMHYDGTSWARINSSTKALFSIWGDSDSSFFAVGFVGTILHYNKQES